MSGVNLASLGRAVLDLVYPPVCSLCRREGSFLCEACIAGLPLADGLRCPRCWLPVAAAGACSRCTNAPLALTALRSVYRYEGDVRRLVHALKFQHQSNLCAPMAALTCRAAGPSVKADVIAYVPANGMRRRQRGFNQAELLAGRIGGELRIPVISALVRVGAQQPQERLPTAAQRWSNVANAFRVAETTQIEGKRVLLVDDVATTCATLDACARQLLSAGASEVAALTFARED